MLGMRTDINNDDASLRQIIDRVTVFIIFIILHNLLTGSSHPDKWKNRLEQDTCNEYFYEYKEKCVF